MKYKVKFQMPAIGLKEFAILETQEYRHKIKMM